MGIGEFLLIVVLIVVLAAAAVWAIGYFSPSPVPVIIPRLIWGIVIVVIFWMLLSATGILSHDIQIPRVR